MKAWQRIFAVDYEEAENVIDGDERERIHHGIRNAFWCAIAFGIVACASTPMPVEKLAVARSSIERAEQAQAESQHLAAQCVRAIGYGEVFPVAGNTRDGNRQLNRRVEIIVANSDAAIPGRAAGAP